MMNRITRCIFCRRDVTVEQGRVRFHGFVPGGSMPCPGGGQKLAALKRFQKIRNDARLVVN